MDLIIGSNSLWFNEKIIHLLSVCRLASYIKYFRQDIYLKKIALIIFKKNKVFFYENNYVSKRMFFSILHCLQGENLLLNMKIGAITSSFCVLTPHLLYLIFELKAASYLDNSPAEHDSQ